MYEGVGRGLCPSEPAGSGQDGHHHWDKSRFDVSDLRNEYSRCHLERIERSGLLQGLYNFQISPKGRNDIIILW